MNNKSMRPVHLIESDLAWVLLQAVKAMGLVLHEGRSMDQALAMALRGSQTPQAKGAVSDLTHYGLRWLGRGQVLAQLLTGKPQLKPQRLGDLLGLALALIWNPEDSKYAVHTVVDQAVKACAADGELIAGKGLMNACLRNFLRERDHWVDLACQKPRAVWNFPDWWINKVRKQHPDHWQNLLRQANEHPPMVLRVNQRVSTGEAYLKRLPMEGLSGQLLAPQTVVLNRPCPVDVLPGFRDGHVSVQDWAAQWAAPLLALQSGQRVLDACSAPGGKTGHLLELADLNLLSLDENPKRLTRVEDNLQRLWPTLGGQSEVWLKAARAQDLQAWWDGQPFDAILADVPCSGAGVVRRHPDIRWLRRPEDVAKLSQLQQKILDSLWSTLKPGGKLLLVTCSIFLEEGPQLADWFVQNHTDAQALPAPGLVLPTPPEPSSPTGAQFTHSPDGFFFALFAKRTAT